MEKGAHAACCDDIVWGAHWPSIIPYIHEEGGNVTYIVNSGGTPPSYAGI